MKQGRLRCLVTNSFGIEGSNGLVLTCYENIADVLFGGYLSGQDAAIFSQ